MRTSFRVYEIEHGADLEASCEDLRRAGCRNVRVRQVNFDAEIMLVECDLPPGVERPGDLRLEHACL